jgi:hypothetical protein
MDLTRPTDPTDPTDLANPAGPNVPTGPADPTGLTGLTDPVGPTRPTDPTDPADLIRSTVPTGPTGPPSPAVPTGPTDLISSAGPASSTDPAAELDRRLRRAAATSGGRVSMVAAVVRYEFLMQVRRPAVWIVQLGLVGLVLLTAGASGPLQLRPGAPLPAVLATWALAVSMVTPLGAGLLLADRGRRERRLGVGALLDATPAGPGVRWWGKAIGATAATITPVALSWAGLTVYLAATHGAAAIPLGLAAFAAVALPGLLFVAAFSLAVPLLTGSPLYRVLFAGYWFWGNLTPPNFVPTLAGTPFEPVGEYASGGWFGGHLLQTVARGIHPGPGQAAFSVAVVLAAALAALAVPPVLARRSAS